MSSRTEVSRREFLTRAFRPPGAPGEAEINPDLAAPETAPEVPDREAQGNLDRVLESLNDLSGIQEP
jgi:hypothetical protein